jgi:hypothetical protein
MSEEVVEAAYRSLSQASLEVGPFAIGRVELRTKLNAVKLWKCKGKNLSKPPSVNGNEPD